MIAVIPTVHGTYNIFGTDGDDFILQGNLTKAQLEELLKAGKKALSEER